MKLVIFGVQGSGKGTQAELISKKFKITHISTGELLRKEAKKNTPQGKKIKKEIESGKLISDNLTIKLIANKIKKLNGFILDGTPRNIIQAKKLEKIIEFDYVIYLMLSDLEAKKRIGLRVECFDCGSIYTFKKGMKLKCKKCGGNLEQRKDDNDAAIKKRIEIYHKFTEPLVKFYKKKNVLVKINGKQTPKKVFSEIIAKINNRN